MVAETEKLASIFNAHIGDYLSKSDRDYLLDVFAMASASKDMALLFLKEDSLSPEFESWRSLWAEVWRSLERDLRIADTYSQFIIQLTVIHRVMDYLNAFGSEFEDIHMNSEIEKALRYFNVLDDYKSGYSFVAREEIIKQELTLAFVPIESIVFYAPFSASSRTIHLDKEAWDTVREYSEVHENIQKMTSRKGFIGKIEQRIRLMRLFLWAIIRVKWHRN